MNRLKKKFQKLDMPSWVYIFPEGFRFNAESKEILAMSRKYAAEYDLPQLKHVLIPRSKVTYAALTCLKSRNCLNAIYDICILYTNYNKSTNQIEYLNEPSLANLIFLESPQVHVHINRVPIENLFLTHKTHVNTLNHASNGFVIDNDKTTITTTTTQSNDYELISEEDVGNWLINLFEKKDNLLNLAYLKDNNFNLISSGHLVKLSFIDTLPSLLFLTLSTVALLSNNYGRKVYGCICICGALSSFLYIKLNS